MSGWPTRLLSYHRTVALAVLLFAIVIFALLSQSQHRWNRMERDAAALTDSLADTRRMVLLAALHTEKLIQGDPASSTELVAAVLSRASASGELLLRRLEEPFSHERLSAESDRFRTAVEAHLAMLLRTTEALRERSRNPFSGDGLDLRQDLHQLDKSTLSVEGTLQEELDRQRAHLRRLDAGTIGLVGMLTMALFTLFSLAEHRRDRALIDLVEGKARLAAFARGLPGLGFLIDAKGRYLAIHGRDSDLALESGRELLERRLQDVLPSDVAGPGMEVIERALHTSETLTHSYSLHLDGQAHWFEARVARVEGTDTVVWLAFDVTTRKEAEQRVSILGAALESAREGVVITDAEGKVVMTNRAFSELTGYAQSEIAGHSLRRLRSEHHDDTFYRKLAASLRGDGYWQGEIWHTARDGTPLPHYMTISAFRDSAGAATHYVVVLTDLRQLKQAQARLERMLTVDPLTGLPNSTSMKWRIERALSATAQEGGVAVMFIDLDEFRTINEGLGYALADELLVAVGRRLQSTLGGANTVGRRGSDEFVALLEGPIAPDDAASMAEALRDCVIPSFQLSNGEEIFIRASVGIAIHPTDGSSADELLRNAETAVHQVKRESLGGQRFYSEALTSAASSRIALESRLRRALQEHAFELHYQPIIDLSSARLIGAEALVRMKPDGEAPIGPAVFVPVMEESGMIHELGDWVQRAACMQARAWLDDDLECGVVSVNLSAAEIRSGTTEAQLQRILSETGLPPERLELEVSESGLMTQGSGAEGFLRRLAAIGVRLSIDDFGTGYSSLAYLKRFPVDKLKVDRTFVRGVPEDRDDAQLVATIVALARNLGLRVVAEGVETERQRDFLRSVGCHAFQGYLASKPLPADEFAKRFLKLAVRA